MPATVWAARFIMIVQLAFSLFGIALMTPGAVALFSNPLILGLLLQFLLVAVLLGWLVFRWSSRRKWVRWCALGLEVVALAVHVIRTVLDGEVSWTTLFGLATLLPLGIIVLLLTPPAARWFVR